jgi:hypothetical protein
MTSVRLLTAAVLVCAASAFAQEQLSSATPPNRTTEAEKSARSTTSETWKIVLNQPPDSGAGKNRLEQPQISQFKIDQFRIDQNRRPFRWGSQNDPILIEPAFLMDGQLGDDTVCYKIRSYVVARDNRESDSVHPVGYSTCQPASRYRLRRTQIQTDTSDR